MKLNKMNTFLLYSLLTFIYSIYLRDEAVEYARQNYNKISHECGDHLKCSPFAYFGKEFCNYTSHGGDCANFVSQCLVYGGKHENLNGTDYCRGYPCGFEEPGAQKLGKCLQEKGWNSTCGKFKEPPSYIKPGDVLIYYESSCDTSHAHAVIITSIEPYVKITGRSELKKDEIYNYYIEKPYYQWLHYIDEDEDEDDDYDKSLDTYDYIITIKKVSLGILPCSEMEGDYYFYINVDMNKDISLSEKLTINLYTSSDQKIEAICTPFYVIIQPFFICHINILKYPLNNVDIYLPNEPPISKKYAFINWKKTIGKSPGISNKISNSKVTCLPKEKNTFIPSSIKSEGCESKKNIFTIYGKWMYDIEDKKPFFWDIDLLILNENNKTAYCEYDPFKLNMKCEYDGYGIIKFEEAYSTCIYIFKMNEFSSSVELEDCTISDNGLNLSSHHLVFLISFIILLY